MKYTYLSLTMILFGMFGLVILVMFESITMNNESEYYVLKEAMEAAMIESIDFGCFRNREQCNGTIKISEQQFVENFTRRFTQSISGNASQYEIEFYDIIETPPKASIVIRGKTNNYISLEQDANDFSLVNNLSGILETNVVWR